MYSRAETVDAVSKFYREILRHPYLDSDALILPPHTGWANITIQGKTNAVVDLLRHLPYLRPEKQYDRLLLHYETIPICHADTSSHAGDEGNYPLPAHCVYLTRSVDALGTCLILDTRRGTLTEYTHSDSHVVLPWDDYDALPEVDRWTGHYTAPVADFLAAWAAHYRALIWMLVPNPVGQPATGRFYSRADSRPRAAELLREADEYGLLPWEPEEDATPRHGESEFDRGQCEALWRERRHTAEVYNLHLSHGWPDKFDKEGCRTKLLDLEKRKDAEDKKIMDAMEDEY